MACATAGVLVIGNEILSGKVADENSPFLARELRVLGVDLRRIEVIPDEVAAIAEAVGRMARQYTFLFTSGGVGPTHDDLTMAGVACAFREAVVRDSLLERTLRAYYGESCNEARLRMANVPRGAVVLSGPGIPIPVVSMRNVYILPGVPDLFQRMFGSIRERFAGSPFHLRRVFVRLTESDIVDVLEQVTAGHAEVVIGSYPRLEQDLPFRVMLTFDSRDRAAADAACQHLLELLPDESVYQVE